MVNTPTQRQLILDTPLPLETPTPRPAPAGETAAETAGEATPTTTPAPATATATRPEATPFTPSTPIDLKLQSNRNIKIVKNHCVFYDLLMKFKIDELLKSDVDSGKKKKYYKELFDDNYDAQGDMTSDEINLFFSDNNLKSSETLINYFIPDNNNAITSTNASTNEPTMREREAKLAEERNKNTLFVIPVFFDDDKNIYEASIELFNPETKTDNKLLLNRDLYTEFYQKLYKKLNGESHDNIYYLPCLLPNPKAKISEDEYVKKIKKELVKLQDYLKEDFLKKMDGGKDQEIFKNISFFCEPDSKISLKFYKKKISAKNIEYLNKHLFKEFLKLRENIQEGKQKFVETEKVHQPMVLKKTKKQIDDIPDKKDKFLTFLVQEVLSGEILSEFKLSELIDIEGVHKLKIMFKTKVKTSPDDFDIRLQDNYIFTRKSIEEFHFGFKIDGGEKDKIEQYKKGKELSKIYWKIKLTGNSGNSSLPFSTNNGEETDKIYLRVTSSEFLKSATIYTKKRNIYESVMKGVVQVQPTRDKYKELQISNLLRDLKRKNIYYFENFKFTLESFKKYLAQVKPRTSTNVESRKKTKGDIRRQFVETFTNKRFLNDYFMFCANDRKFKKNILTNFYNDDTTTEEQTRIKKETIESLLKELFKKGSIFYKKEQKQQRSLTNNTSSKKDSATYNTYRIRRFNYDKNQLLISSSDQSNDTGAIHKELVDNGVEVKDINKFLDHNADKAVVQIYLEKDDKDGLLDNNNNTKLSEFITPKKDKCSTRKKIVKKKVGEFIKTATRAVSMKMMGII